MTARNRRLYRLAIAICIADIAMAALAHRVHPDSWLPPFTIGLCIAMGVFCTQRLRQDRTGGVEA